MKAFVLIFSSLSCCVLANYAGIPTHQARSKRDVSGALDIVTNNAPAIHTDVKHDNEPSEAVTPPKAAAVYEPKSGRKSWPLTSRIELVRSVTRVVTLAVLVLSAAVEFYPLIQQLYYFYASYKL